MITWALAWLGLFGCGPTRTDPVLATTVRPNILIIDIDSLRSDRIALGEDGTTVAPNIMGLASEGVHFSRVVVPSGWTLPSFVTLLAGRIPSNTLLASDEVELDAVGGDRLLPAILEAYGYQTGVAWGNTTLSQHSLVHRWFGEGESADLGNIEAYTMRVLEGVDTPFFHLIHDMDLHVIWDSDAASRSAVAGDTRSEWTIQWDWMHGQYDALLGSYDLKLGALLEALHSAGLRENTIIVVISNHGEELEDHHPGISGHGVVLFDNVSTVPLVIAGPMLSARGERIETPILLQDLAPTLLALADIPIHAEMTGVSLVSAFQDGGASLPRRDGFSSTFSRAAAVRSDPFKLILQPLGCPAEERREFPGLEGLLCQTVYDLDEDPKEKRDISAANPDLTTSLRNRLGAFLATQAWIDPRDHDAQFRAQMRRKGYWQAATEGGESRDAKEGRDETEAPRIDSMAVNVQRRVMPNVGALDGDSTDAPLSCRIMFEVDTEGVPTSTTPIVCDERYADEVLAAAEKWRFHPWMVDGKPAPFRVVKEIRFTSSER
jgi:arylsulfatase A-like enzyme